jgi:hypothetical protein
MLFARYAHGPNALGYCGPREAAVLARVARGQDEPDAVRAAARRFSGAWPYLQAIAALCGRDPMDPEVVRGYWVGNELTATLDRDAFAADLLTRLRAAAGHYWPHLSDELTSEVAPSHAFHVLGVYPWSRLLAAGRAEPLHILESCRIAWARVIAISDSTVTVEGPRLTIRRGHLALGPAQRRQVGYLLDGKPFGAVPRMGETVAVHWDFVCDRLTESDVAHLARSLQRQLRSVAARGTG